VGLRSGEAYSKPDVILELSSRCVQVADSLQQQRQIPALPRRREPNHFREVTEELMVS
jgi:hypothetical protein